MFQEAERKIPLNYASRYTSKAGGLQKSAYLPFKVNSAGVMPIIFSTSSLALPATLARFTGISALKNVAYGLNPGGESFENCFAKCCRDLKKVQTQTLLQVRSIFRPIYFS